MKTDSIWYNMFLKFPDIFFELIGEPTTGSNSYRFDSVEVKELSFRIDGVFLPKSKNPELPIHFVEVQFQKDENLYSRLFTEIFIYLRQHKPDHDWLVTVVYPSRSIEAVSPGWYREFFNSGRLQRIYLDELEPDKSPTVGQGMVKLIVTPPNEAVSLAKGLFQQTKQDIASPKLQKDLIELLETIMVYKLPNKGREEIEAMFGLSELKQTKVYQEAKMEGIIEGEIKGRTEGEIKGRTEGRIEGRTEGEINAKMEAVPGLLKLGLTVEQIATALKLSVEEIQQVVSSNN